MQQHETPKWILTSLTRGRGYDPFAHAEALDIQVIFRPIQSANEMWLPEHHTVVIKDSMRACHQRNACAHGVAHAALHHMDDRPKHEVQADRYAADNLIDHDELLELMLWTEDSGRLAQELGVTTRLLRVYLNVHRLAGRTSPTEPALLP